jgi:hypothetical protein
MAHGRKLFPNESPGTELVAREGVHHVGFQTVRLKWIFREEGPTDVGIDAQIEIVKVGRATGSIVGLQINSGMSYLAESNHVGFVHRGDRGHLAYWSTHVLPVIVVLYDPSTIVAHAEEDIGWLDRASPDELQAYRDIGEIAYWRLELTPTAIHRAHRIMRALPENNPQRIHWFQLLQEAEMTHEAEGTLRAEAERILRPYGGQPQDTSQS